MGSLTSDGWCCARLSRFCCEESPSCALAFGSAVLPSVEDRISSLPRSCCCCSPSSRYLPWIRPLSRGVLISSKKFVQKAFTHILE